MQRVLRHQGDPPLEVELSRRPIVVGSADDADVRIDAEGIDAAHIRIDLETVHALADCSVGEVTLRRGEDRLLVPWTTLRLGSVILDVVERPAPDASTAEFALQIVRAQMGEGTGVAAPTVRVVAGRDAGAELVLREDRYYTVGRAPGCELLLRDLEVSRQHLSIKRQGDEVLVRDLSASTGSWLGSARLRPEIKALWPRQTMVRIGTTVLALILPLRVEDDEDDAASASTSASASASTSASGSRKEITTETDAAIAGATAALTSPPVEEAPHSASAPSTPIVLEGPIARPPVQPPEPRSLDRRRDLTNIAVFVVGVTVIVVMLAALVYLLAFV